MITVIKIYIGTVISLVLLSWVDGCLDFGAIKRAMIWPLGVFLLLYFYVRRK